MRDFSSTSYYAIFPIPSSAGRYITIYWFFQSEARGYICLNCIVQDSALKNGGFSVAANGCHREEQKGLLDTLLFKHSGNIFRLWKDCFHRAILAIIN